MAEDCVDHAIILGKLDDPPCVTKRLHIHGYQEETAAPGSAEENLAVYGSDAEAIRALAADDPKLAERLHPALPYIGRGCAGAAHTGAVSERRRGYRAGGACGQTAGCGVGTR
jgi:glycerol-3-phosphate dehydrogenase